MWTECQVRLILVAMARASHRLHQARGILSANMKARRLAMGFSQERVAALARLHPNYIGSVERGERNVSIDNIEKIAAALSLPISALFQASAPKGGRRASGREAIT